MFSEVCVHVSENKWIPTCIWFGVDEEYLEVHLNTTYLKSSWCKYEKNICSNELKGTLFTE